MSGILVVLIGVFVVICGWKFATANFSLNRRMGAMVTIVFGGWIILAGLIVSIIQWIAYFSA